MPKIRDGLSMRHNGTQWIASYRLLDGSWGTWRAPGSIAAKAELEAERHFLDRYEQYLGSGVQPTRSQVTSCSKVTLSDIAPKWIEYRRQDPGTDPKYAKSLDSQWRTHIEGHDIAKINLADLDGLEITTWIRQLHGKPSTKLTVASTLSVMLTDCIRHGQRWGVDPRMVHPMLSSVQVSDELAKLYRERHKEQVKPNLTVEQAETLLTFRTSKIEDARRVKYTVRLWTGIREAEAQGLTFLDVVELPIPHVWVRRQLVSGGALPFRWLKEVRQECGNKVDLSTLPFAVVGPPKEECYRPVPLMPIVVETLKWWRTIGWRQFVGRDPDGSDPIFPSGNRNRHQAKGQFATASAGYIMKADLERCGLPTSYTSPRNGLTADHDSRTLRRTFASLLDAVGIDEAKIGTLMGHASGTVTGGHYIERVLRPLAEAVSQLPIPPRVVFRAHEVDLREAVQAAPVLALRRG